MTPAQDERLTLILQGLEPCRKELYAKARDFVDDQIKRHDQYGQRMFVSPRQIKWLEDLYKEFVGGELPAAEDDYRGPEQTARDDMGDERVGSMQPLDPDDEIPF